MFPPSLFLARARDRLNLRSAEDLFASLGSPFFFPLLPPSSPLPPPRPARPLRRRLTRAFCASSHPSHYCSMLHPGDAYSWRGNARPPPPPPPPPSSPFLASRAINTFAAAGPRRAIRNESRHLSGDPAVNSPLMRSTDGHYYGRSVLSASDPRQPSPSVFTHRPILH